MLKQNTRNLTVLKVVSDAAFIIAAFFAAWLLKFVVFPDGTPHLPLSSYAALLYIACPAFFILQAAFSMYGPLRTRSGHKEVYRVFLNSVLLFVILLSYIFLFKIHDISRVFVALFCAFSFVFVAVSRLATRFALRILRKKGYNIKHIVLIGLTDQGKSYLNAVLRHVETGYHPFGYLDKSENKAYRGVPHLGTPEDLRRILEENTIDEAVIALPLSAYDTIPAIIQVCESCGVKSVIIPAYAEFVPAKPQIDEIDDIPLINTRYIPLDNMLYAAVKYGADFVISLGALILLSPVLLGAAIAVKCTSKGPVLFKQTRIGYNKKPFKMYKFRTMRIGSDGGWTKANDPRITPVGRFLRRTNIDELPQLINVLKGDMSLVGPRPEQGIFVEKFKETVPKYMLKHRVRPGLTGLAQVNGCRGDTSIEKRISYDIYYIENWNIFLDMKIMLLTLFTRRGYQQTPKKSERESV